MSWAAKIHKKQQANKKAKEIINSEAYQARIAKDREQYTNRALDCYLLITAKYLIKNFRCKQTGVLNFVDFAIEEILASQSDENHFIKINEELKKSIGVDLLQNLKFKRKPTQEKAQN